MRFYSDHLQSFHPKSYIFDYEDEAEVFVGSSNLSFSGLTSGVEWNYKLSKSEHLNDYRHFSEVFEELFNRCSNPVTDELLKEYSLKWKKPKLVKAEEQLGPILPKPEPRGAQIEALYYLKQARLEGVSRGLVAAATGVGKTHLAAFDTLQFKKILFIAHRGEIVSQAYDIFKELRPKSDLGYYTGEQKDKGADIYFSTVQTLSREENLELFHPNYFDYIVI
nr:DEAD/DEAH box helicase family protein [Candidatus Contubernalis alkalaceticus]